jgi:hypothetical protein
MSASVEALLGTDLSVLDQVGVQAEADRLRGLIGRLSGRLDQVLAELDVRGGGQVQTNPGSEHAALYQSVQGWWRDTATSYLSTWSTSTVSRTRRPDGRASTVVVGLRSAEGQEQ